jgi:hypothetical protein
VLREAWPLGNLEPILVIHEKLASCFDPRRAPATIDEANPDSQAQPARFAEAGQVHFPTVYLLSDESSLRPGPSPKLSDRRATPPIGVFVGAGDRSLPGCAICPARGVGAALALPYADADMKELHLDEISRNVTDGAHAVLLLDRAGWHTTSKLDVPGNITPIFLPSRAPELNPVENVWQYLRQNWLSNTVFENYDAIIDAACAAWRKLIAQPETITSIGMRNWAHVGQPL